MCPSGKKPKNMCCVQMMVGKNGRMMNKKIKCWLLLQTNSFELSKWVIFIHECLWKTCHGSRRWQKMNFISLSGRLYYWSEAFPLVSRLHLKKNLSLIYNEVKTCTSNSNTLHRKWDLQLQRLFFRNIFCYFNITPYFTCIWAVSVAVSL